MRFCFLATSVLLTAAALLPAVEPPMDRAALERIVATHRQAIESDAAVAALRQARERSDQALRAALVTDEYRKLDQAEDATRDAVERRLRELVAADAEAGPLATALAQTEARVQAAETAGDQAALDVARQDRQKALAALRPHRERLSSDPSLAELHQAADAARTAKSAAANTPEIVALRQQADADNQAYKAAVKERLRADPEAGPALAALEAMQ
jgi:hypothetical protein